MREYRCPFSSPQWIYQGDFSGLSQIHSRLCCSCTKYQQQRPYLDSNRYTSRYIRKEVYSCSRCCHLKRSHLRHCYIDICLPDKVPDYSHQHSMLYLHLYHCKHLQYSLPHVLKHHRKICTHWAFPHIPLFQIHKTISFGDLASMTHLRTSIHS